MTCWLLTLFKPRDLCFVLIKLAMDLNQISVISGAN